MKGYKRAFALAAGVLRAAAGIAFAGLALVAAICQLQDALQCLTYAVPARKVGEALTLTDWWGAVAGMPKSQLMALVQSGVGGVCCLSVAVRLAVRAAVPETADTAPKAGKIIFFEKG